MLEAGVVEVGGTGLGVAIGVEGVFGVATGIIGAFKVVGSIPTRQAEFTPTKPRLKTRLSSVPKNPTSCRSIVND